MLTSQDFAERYKKVSNAELLDILQHPAGYQLIALQAAKAEFAVRQLSEKDISEAKQVLQDKQLQKEKRHENVDLIKTKVSDAGNFLYENIKPQEAIPTSKKIIVLICISFFGLTIFEIINCYRSIRGMSGGNGDMSFVYILVLFPTLVLLSGTILFSLRKQSGWVILGLYCGTTLMLYLGAFFYDMFRNSRYGFTGIPPIMPVIFYGAALIGFCRQDIKEIYKIDKQNMISTLIAGGLFGIVALLALTHL